jgi:hypothetical protein
MESCEHLRITPGCFFKQCRAPYLISAPSVVRADRRRRVASSSLPPRLPTSSLPTQTCPTRALEALDSLPFPKIDAKPYESGRFDQYLSYVLARLKHNDEREARGEERIPRKGPVPKRGPFKPKAAKPATPKSKAAPKGKTPKAKTPATNRTEGIPPAQGAGPA